MVKLWEITEAQAEAMSTAHAAKILAENEAEPDNHGEAGDRELEGYALDYATGSPRKDKHGKWVVLKHGHDVENAPELWRFWSKILPEKKMFELSVLEASQLQPNVLEILENKVKEPLRVFKEQASEATKSKWEQASDAVKATILGKWLAAKGHHHLIHDGGRRRTRRGRKGRRTTRKH